MEHIITNPDWKRNPEGKEHFRGYSVYYIYFIYTYEKRIIRQKRNQCQSLGFHPSLSSTQKAKDVDIV